MPAYNQGAFIAEAIESVLAQDYPQDKIEIIVADDGSTDETREICKKFGSRLTYIYQSNRGKALATKAGIEAANGTYIFNLDADDKFLPGKIREVVELFEKDTDIVHIAHPVIYWDADKNTQKAESIPAEIKGRKIDGKELARFFLRHNRFIGGGSSFAGRARDYPTPSNRQARWLGASASKASPSAQTMMP